MRNRLFRDNQARDCQEIEELRRIPRQARIDELSTHQERNPTTVSQLLTQLQDLRNKVHSLSDAREFFTILKQLGALERPTFPVNPLLFRVPGPSLAASLDCCTIHGILWVLQDTFLNDHLLEEDGLLLSSTIQRIWHPPL